MSSLEFQNLPLIEATCNVMFSGTREIDLDTIMLLRKDLHGELPNALGFVGGLAGPTVPFLVLLGPELGASFGNEKGVSVALRPDRLTTKWRRTSAGVAYVRYPYLRDRLESAAARLVDLNPRVVNMAYVNLAPKEHGAAEDLIDATAWPHATSRPIRDYNVAWLLPTGEEFRLQVTPRDEGTLVTTAAGVEVTTGWLSDLDRVHEILQEQFLKLITQHAKEIWKWQSR